MGRSVSELLDTVSARELAEWRAYERFAGPIDDQWLGEAISQLTEHLHDLMYLTSQAHFTDKAHRKGPIEKREESYPRPRDVYRPED